MKDCGSAHANLEIYDHMDRIDLVLDYNRAYFRWAVVMLSWVMIEIFLPCLLVSPKFGLQAMSDNCKNAPKEYVAYLKLTYSS